VAEISRWSALKMSKEKLLDRFGNPLSDGYCSPRWLTALLPPVDLDPCSNPRSTVRSKRSFSLEKKLDGLKLPWAGSVFVNWPYSDPGPWAEKLIQELTAKRCTEAIVLCKLDPSVGWWHTLMGFAGPPPDLWMFDRRIDFDEPEELVAARLRKFAERGKPGGEKSSSNFASAILHYRGNEREARPDVPSLKLDMVASCWRSAA
jgi:hypothetical protein